jgi:hypothetical protein
MQYPQAGRKDLETADPVELHTSLAKSTPRARRPRSTYRLRDIT